MTDNKNKPPQKPQLTRIPLDFDTAVTDLLKVKPPKKNGGKKAKKKSN